MLIKLEKYNNIPICRRKYKKTDYKFMSVRLISILFKNQIHNITMNTDRTKSIQKSVQWLILGYSIGPG